VQSPGNGHMCSEKVHDVSPYLIRMYSYVMEYAKGKAVIQVENCHECHIEFSTCRRQPLPTRDVFRQVLPNMSI